MKKLLIAGAIMLGCLTTNAQVQTPMASPSAKIEQTVGLTNVKIDYSRPSARGRSVYGELVPFGKLWRTGANTNTVITFSDDVVIDGKTLPKGEYALYTLPKADSWDIIFYGDTHNWGLPEKWDEKKEVLRTTVKPEFLPKNIETFTINIADLDNDFANLELSWERTKVTLKFVVPTKEKAIESIETAMAGPSASDYFSAAQYYYQSNADMNKALEWINNSIAKTPSGQDVPFYILRQKSLIQAKMGDKKGAIETAKQSLAGAEKANNYDYVKMNKDSILEWSRK